MKAKEKQHSVPSNPNMMKKPCVLVLIEHLSWHPGCCTHITLKYSFIHTHWTQSRHPCWAARWAEPQSISIWARSPLLAVRRYWALVAHQWFEFRASCQPASMTAAVMKKKSKITGFGKQLLAAAQREAVQEMIHCFSSVRGVRQRLRRTRHTDESSHHRALYHSNTLQTRKHLQPSRRCAGFMAGGWARLRGGVWTPDSSHSSPSEWLWYDLCLWMWQRLSSESKFCTVCLTAEDVASHFGLPQ